MKSKIITLILIGLSTWLALFIGGDVFPLLGSAISAILIGMVLRHIPAIYNLMDKGTIHFITSYVLKGGIVLLGFTMSVQILGEVGLILIVIMMALIAGSILTSFFINRGIKANKN